MATPTNLPSSFSAGDVLTAAQMNDLRGAFRILQVTSATVDNITQSTTSSTMSDITGLSVTLTPQATSSKVFIIASINVGANGAADNTFYNLKRDTTTLAPGTGATNNVTAAYRFSYDGAGFQTFQIANLCITYLDSPSTTSSTTYKMQWATRVGTLYLNRAGDTNIGVSSTITAFEISA